MKHRSWPLFAAVLACPLAKGSGAEPASVARGTRSLQETRTAEDWDRAALERGATGDTDAEMRAWLEALRLEDGDRRRRELGRLAAPRERVRVTVRHEPKRWLRDLALSREGDLLATVAGELCVWDAVTGRLLWEADGERSPSFSADGRWLASYSKNGAFVRDSRSGEAISTIVAPTDETLEVVKLGPGGRTLATVSRGWKGLTIHDVASGRTLTGPHEGDFWSPVIDPAGDHVAAIFHEGDEGDGRGILVWSRSRGIRTFPGYVECIAFAPDGSRLAAMAGYHLRILDLETMEWSADRRAVAGFFPWSVTFRPDGTVACAGNGVAWVWDADACRLVGRPRWQDDLDDRLRERTEDYPTPLSPDGTRHALGGLGDTLRIWSTDTGEPVAPPLLGGETIDRAMFAADARTIATASDGGLVRVWDVPQVDAPAPPPDVTDAQVERAAGGIAVRRNRSRINLLDLDLGRYRALTEVGSHEVRLAFDPSGWLLAIAEDNGEVSVLDLDGRTLAGPLRNTELGDVQLAEERLTLLDYFATVAWDLTSARPVSIHTACFPAWVVPSGRSAVECEDAVRWWDLEDGREETFVPSAGSVLSVDPTGAFVLCEDEDHLVVHDLATRREIDRRWFSGREAWFAIDGGALLVKEGDGLLLWVPGEAPRAIGGPGDLDLEELYAGHLLLHAGRERLVAVSERSLHVRDDERGWRALEVPVECGFPMILDPTGCWLAWASEAPEVTEIALPLAGPAPAPSVSPVDVDESHYAHGLPVAVSPGGNLAWMDGPRYTVHQMRPGGKTADSYFHGAHQDEVVDLAWSTSGILAILGARGRAEIGNQAVTAPGSPDRIAVHPDGRTWAFAAGSLVTVGGPEVDDGYERALDVRAERDLDTSPITVLAFSADGTRLAVGCRDGELHWLDPSDLAEVAPPQELDAGVLALADAGDGTWLVGDRTGVLRLGGDGRRWDLGTMVVGIGFVDIPDTDRSWIAAGVDGRWHVWYSLTDNLNDWPIVDRRATPGPVRVTRDEVRELTACAFEDGSVVVRSVADGALAGPPFCVQGEVRDLRFDSTGAGLIVVTEYAVTGWDVASGTRRGPPLDKQYDRCVTTLDDPMVWAGMHDGLPRVIRIEDQAELWSAPRRNRPWNWRGLDFTLHPDGEHVLLRGRVYAHLLRVVGGERVEVIGTRRLPQHEQGHALEFLAGLRVLVGVDVNADPPAPRVLDFADPGPVRLEGEPEALVRDWERRLGWTVEDGRLAPRGR